jgi:hypothetical protein
MDINPAGAVQSNGKQLSMDVGFTRMKWAAFQWRQMIRDAIQSSRKTKANGWGESTRVSRGFTPVGGISLSNSLSPGLLLFSIQMFQFHFRTSNLLHYSIMLFCIEAIEAMAL